METTTELSHSRLLGTYSYPTSHRVIEIVSIAVFAVFYAVFGLRAVAAVGDDLDVATVGLTVLAAFLALVLADFLSGMVHALCDNLGSVDTPVVGQKFIRSFREHHTDPLDMTRGDFVRVNADNFLVCLPILIPCVLWLNVGSNPFVSTFLVVLMAFVVVTNQIHKWAHTDQVPGPVQWLQARRIVLSPDHHRVHHTPPYDSHYCITSGVTNPLLTKVGFWPVLLRFCRWAGRFLGGSPATGSSQGPGA